MDTFFPCIPRDLRAMFYGNVLSAAAQYQMQPWAWAVCNSGSWIYRGNSYVWVAGRRHHHPCIHWIRSGGTIAFVPIHPHDIRDRLPVNRKAVAFALDTRNGGSVQRISLGSTEPVSLLKQPPREFRNTLPSPLPRAAEPRMEGHQLRDGLAAKGEPVHSTSIPITFDYHTQNFMMPSRGMTGGRTASGFVPIANRGGDLQSHGGAFSGGGSYHGGSSGGSNSSNHASGSSVSSSSNGASVSSGVTSSAASSTSASGGGSHK